MNPAFQFNGLKNPLEFYSSFIFPDIVVRR